MGELKLEQNQKSMKQRLRRVRDSNLSSTTTVTDFAAAPVYAELNLQRTNFGGFGNDTTVWGILTFKGRRAHCKVCPTLSFIRVTQRGVRFFLEGRRLGRACLRRFYAFLGHWDIILTPSLRVKSGNPNLRRNPLHKKSRTKHDDIISTNSIERRSHWLHKFLCSSFTKPRDKAIE